MAEARPYWVHIGVIFLLSLLATPIALLLPVPLKIAVDNVVGDKPLPGWLDALMPDSLQGANGVLVFAVLLLVAVGLASQLQTLATQLLRTYTGERLTLHFRSQLFRHIQRLSISFHDRQGTADSNYRIQSDAASLQTIAVDGVIPFVASLLTLVAMLYVAARIDAVLAAIALVVAPALVLLTWAYRRRLRQRHREVKQLESSALSIVQEVLTSLRVVKAFGQEDREERRFVGRAGQGMRARMRVTAIDGSFLVAIGLVTTLGTAAVLYTGIRRVESGAITLGSLLLVMGYLTQLYGPLSTISRRVTSLQSAFASAERIFTLLDEEQDVPERSDAKPLGRAAGAVEFRDVSFAYDGRPIVEDVSFSVEPGTRVGIAGRTGAGKTTLVGLLTRFYDPTAGAILLDGVDIRDYRVADLRDQFAIVLQEPVLFSTTIAENIAYGRRGATYFDIVAAAEAADLHEFINGLPEGYDTPVGERGMSLSGGERQRVSLARAFLKDAPILILDEPTSSVDLKTEATIIDAMERLMRGRTTFMIAHRLSTLHGCDTRLRIERGRLFRTRVSPRRLPVPERASSPAVVTPTAKAEAEAVVLRRDLDRHPACLAWRVAVEDDRMPASIEILKLEKQKSAVYRLNFLGHGHPSVIAKRRPEGELADEIRLHGEFLPALPMGTLELFGHAEGLDGFDWLFLEDAGGTCYSREAREHQALAIEWLGRLHAGASPGASWLPDTGPAYFRSVLDLGRNGLGVGLSHPALSTFDREVLTAILTSLDTVEEGWQQVEELCARMPRTLVHGDFVPKNVRVRERLGQIDLVVFDWETAGVGPPAVDIALLRGTEKDLRKYLAIVNDVWPELRLQDVQQLALIGDVFRLLHAIYWDSRSFAHEWVEHAMWNMIEYERHLRMAVTDDRWIRG